MRDIKRGQIYIADLNPVKGSEQGGIRPVIVIQNDIGNRYSPTIIVAAITGRDKSNIPTHSRIQSNVLPDNSIVLLEQIRTIDKCRLLKYIGKVTNEEMNEISDAIKRSFDL